MNKGYGVIVKVTPPGEMEPPSTTIANMTPSSLRASR